MKKIFLIALTVFGMKAAMAQESVALGKIGKSVVLTTIKNDYNACGCYVLDTTFHLQPDTVWTSPAKTTIKSITLKAANGGTTRRMQGASATRGGAVKSGSSVVGRNGNVVSTDGWEFKGAAVTLKSSACYYLPGLVKIDSGITFNVPAGTKFYGSKLTNSAFVELPGATVNVNGTAAAPVIFTSAMAPLSRARGDWGGVVIMGRAPLAGNAKGTVRGNYTYIEGPDWRADHMAGGSIEGDNSGKWTYFAINYGGINFGSSGSGNELNGLSLYGVGNKTTIANVQVYQANDDAIEFFGGSVNVNNALLVNTLDDDLDIDCGYKGTISNVVVFRLDSNSRDVSGSKLIECSSVVKNHPRHTAPVITNLTAFGPRSNPGFGKNYVFGKTVNGTSNDALGYFRGAEANTNSSLRIYNAIIHGYDQVLNVADSWTANNLINDSFGGIHVEFSSVNNVKSLVTETAGNANKAGTFTSAFRGSYPFNSGDNWFKYNQQYNMVLPTDAIKNQGYNLTFSVAGFPSLTDMAKFYTTYGTDYSVVTKALQTLGTSWGLADSLDARLTRKSLGLTRIENRGHKSFWSTMWVDLDPQDDYCPSAIAPSDVTVTGNMDKVANVVADFEYNITNPAVDAISVTVDNSEKSKVQVTVFDLSGKKVVSQTSRSENFSLNSESLVNGIYVVTVEKNGVVKSEKVIVNK